MIYDIDGKIIEKIKTQWNDNLEGEVFLTDRLALRTKELVREAKRFYHSIYRDNNDENTIFWPLVKRAVDSIVANCDFDLKDINVVGKTKGSRAKTTLFRELLLTHLKNKQFGKIINEAEVGFVRDGTVIVRTWEENGEPMSQVIDHESIWTDYATNNPTFFLERLTLPRESIPENWNKDYLSENGTSKLLNLGLNNRNEIVVWRYEGLMPRSWINGIQGDDKPVLGLLFITGLASGEKSYIQSRKILDYSSYDFAQFSPNSARFIACGVPESLRQLQKYANLVINNRIKRANLASKGLLLVQKSSGISPDMVDSLAEGGSIPVNKMDDVHQLPVQDVTSVSFNEEQAIMRMADTMTGNTEISRGELQRSNVTLGQTQIEANFSSLRFSFLKEQLAFMFEKIVTKWAKIIVENMSVEEIIRVADENVRIELAQELSKADLANTLATNFKKLGVRGLLAASQLYDENYFFTKRFKDNEFKLLKESAKNLEWEIEISLNSEGSDKQTTTNNLIQLLQLAPAVPEIDRAEIVKRLFELSGLSVLNFENKNAGMVGSQQVISAQ